MLRLALPGRSGVYSLTGGGPPPGLVSYLSGQPVPGRAIPARPPSPTSATAVNVGIPSDLASSHELPPYISNPLPGGTINAQQWELAVLPAVLSSLAGLQFSAYLHVMVWRPSTDSFVAFIGDGYSSPVVPSIGSTVGPLLVAEVAGSQTETEPSDVLVFTVRVAVTKSVSNTGTMNVRREGDLPMQAGYPAGTIGSTTIPQYGTTFASRGGMTVGFHQPGLFETLASDTLVRRAGTVDKNYFRERRAGIVEKEKTGTGRRSGIAFLLPPTPQKKLYLSASEVPTADRPLFDPLRLLSTGWFSYATPLSRVRLFGMSSVPEPLPPVIGNDNIQNLPGGRWLTTCFVSRPLAADVLITPQTWTLKAPIFSYSGGLTELHVALSVWRPSTERVVGTLVVGGSSYVLPGITFAINYGVTLTTYAGEQVQAAAGDVLILEVGAQSVGSFLSSQIGLGLFGGSIDRAPGVISSNSALVQDASYLSWDQEEVTFVNERTEVGRLAGALQLQPTLVSRRAGTVALNQTFARRAATVLRNKGVGIRRAGLAALTWYDRTVRRAGFVALDRYDRGVRRAGRSDLAFRESERLAHSAELQALWSGVSERRAGTVFLRSTRNLLSGLSSLWPISGRLARITNPVHTFLANVVDFFQMVVSGGAFSETEAFGQSEASLEDSGVFHYTLPAGGASEIQEQSQAGARFEAAVPGTSDFVLEDETVSEMEVSREVKTAIVSVSGTTTSLEVSHGVIDSVTSWDDASAWMEVSFSPGTVITLQDESFATVEVGGIVLDQFEFRSASWAVLVKPYEASINPTPRVLSGSAALVNQPPRPPPSPVPTVTGPGPRPDGVRGAASVVNPAPPRVRGKAEEE
jgi:hypothetical protein